MVACEKVKYRTLTINRGSSGDVERMMARLDADTWARIKRASPSANELRCCCQHHVPERTIDNGIFITGVDPSEAHLNERLPAVIRLMGPKEFPRTLAAATPD